MKKESWGRASGDNRGAKYWIEKLQLEPHPEGGYFRQTYKSDLLIEPKPVAPSSSRFLRQGGDFDLPPSTTAALNRCRQPNPCC